MKNILVSLFLIASMVGCTAALEVHNGVELRPGEAAAEKLYNLGLGPAWPGGKPPWASSDSEFSQFYSTSKGDLISKKHIEAPTKLEIKDEPPATVYFGYQMQAMSYAQYVTIPAYTSGNSLWIQGATSWSQYAQAPQGSALSLLATSSAGGNGVLYEIADGALSQNSFQFFPGTSRITFYADTAGQHILLFLIDGQVSNAIVIEVGQNAVQYAQPLAESQEVTYPHGTYLNPVQS